MMDDDDVEWVAILWPTGGWLISIIGLIVLVVMLVVVSGNKDDCARLQCSSGKTPKLMQHECLCVELAK
jgi:hypothetical protein